AIAFDPWINLLDVSARGRKPGVGTGPSNSLDMQNKKPPAMGHRGGWMSAEDYRHRHPARRVPLERGIPHPAFTPSSIGLNIMIRLILSSDLLGFRQPQELSDFIANPPG